jgi:hypothetical protein
VHKSNNPFAGIGPSNGGGGGKGRKYSQFQDEGQVSKRKPSIRDRANSAIGEAKSKANSLMSEAKYKANKAAGSAIDSMQKRIKSRASARRPNVAGTFTAM